MVQPYQIRLIYKCIHMNYHTILSLIDIEMIVH